LRAAYEEVKEYLAFLKVFILYGKDTAEEFRGKKAFSNGELAGRLKKALKVSKKEGEASTSAAAAGKGKQERAFKRPRQADYPPVTLPHFFMPAPPPLPQFAQPGPQFAQPAPQFQQPVYGQRPSNRPTGDRCKKCGGFGHWARECPKP
jgi:hypothetical protein